MATKINVGIDNEVITLNEADAAKLLETQALIMAEQQAQELAAENKLIARESALGKLQALGLTPEEAQALLS